LICPLWLVMLVARMGMLEIHAQSAQNVDTLADRIVVIPLQIDDLRDPARGRELVQMLDKAQEEKARVIVFDLKVTGDISWDSQERILEKLANLKVPTIAFVNSTATGTGALVAIGSDAIYLSSGGIIGGAGLELSKEKDRDEAAAKRDLARQLSLLKARARSLARAKGHREEIVEAFIDSEIEVKYGEELVSKKGDILTLTAAEAFKTMPDGKPLLAAGIVDSLEALLQTKQLQGDPIRISPRDFMRQRNQTRLKSSSGEPSPTDKTTPVESKEDEGLFSKRSGKSYKDQIVVIKVGEDALSSGKAQFEFMDRTLKKAQLDGATAVIFDLDTPGGFAWYTQGLVLNSLQSISIPTFAFVNTRAESAGAIVALGTDHIYMRPAASIGSALVVSGTGTDLTSAMESKTTQMIISVVRNIAELKGHNPDIAEAFVTRTKEVRIGNTVLHPSGEVLNLNTIRATEVIDGKPVLAKGIADSLEDLVKKESLSGEIVEATSLGMESFAKWVQRFSAILIIIGIAGIYLEMKTPGFALPGAIGLGAFALYFFGNNMAGSLAGYELAVILILGLLLIGVEIFLFPGAVIPALIGGLMVLFSLWFAMVDRVDWEWQWKKLPTPNWTGTGVRGWMDIFRDGLQTSAIGILGAMVLILVMIQFLPKTSLGGLLILRRSLAGGGSIDGQMTEGAGHEAVSYVGWTGDTTTDLMPSGKGKFDGKYLDIISRGEFIPKDTAIVVTHHEGSRIVVKRV